MSSQNKIKEVEIRSDKFENHFTTSDVGIGFPRG